MEPQTPPKLLRSDKYTFLVIGDSKVGKESIITRLVCGYFPHMYWRETSKHYGHIDPKRYTIKFNKANSDAYADFRMNSGLMRRCDAVLIVYDVCNRSSFENVNGYLRMLRLSRSGRGVEVMLLGNKIDKAKERVVLTREGQLVAGKAHIGFVEYSALDGIGMQEVVADMVRNLRLRKDRRKNGISKQEVMVEQNTGLRAIITRIFKTIFRAPAEQ